MMKKIHEKKLKRLRLKKIKGAYKKPIEMQKHLKVKKGIKMTAEKREKPLPNYEAMDVLLHKGRLRGFITEAEILYALPEVEEYISDYEKLLNRIDEMGVQIIEVDGGYLDKAKNSKEVLEKIGLKSESKRRIDTTDITADSIQMYLREIGKVSLLRADE